MGKAARNRLVFIIGLIGATWMLPERPRADTYCQGYWTDSSQCIACYTCDDGQEVPCQDFCVGDNNQCDSNNDPACPRRDCRAWGDKILCSP
jgi:hypothetical protein